MTATSRWSDFWRAPLHDFPLRDEILVQAMPFAASDRVLEIGPGSGFTAFWLSRRVRQITLADVAEVAVEALSADLGARANVRCIQADVTDPAFELRVGTGFDAAFGLDVLEYVSDPAACFHNLAEVLRPGGRLLLTFPNVPPPVGDGVTYFEHAADLELSLEKAGFQRWAVGAVRLRPWAAALYRALHEAPLGFYRRLRAGERAGRPQTYEATWAFRHGRRMLRYKVPVHLAWLVVDRLMRLGGPFFADLPIEGRILGHQLVIRAWR